MRTVCALLGLAAALGAGACAGTPLPEPPDALPRPQLADARDTSVPPVTASTMTFALVTVLKSEIPPGTQLTLLNLDAPAARVSMDSVTDAGGVLSALVPAAPGDRVRVLFTNDRAHSPPLDLQVRTPEVAGAATLPVDPLGDTSLPCLQLTPNESLVLSGTRGQVSVRNTCEVAVALTRAALRTGAEGIQLVAPASPQIAAGASITLSLEDSQGPGERERLDVLLLDVSATDGRSGRYAVDVFSDLQ
jgi:hypothetical protein